MSDTYRAALVIVPDPITSKDRTCSLSVERLLPHFELAYFSGSGFPQDTQVSFESQSYGEKHAFSTRTDHDGNLRFSQLPFVSGHRKGTTTVKGIAANCSLSITFDWGD
ncbi:MAG: hypothetical protein H0X25_08730 [Acidobacteriales bacterium]|nr:hypothetical protein [Terriglobales bacterium]